ncbi:CoA-binding protein [Halolamina sediminis]|jgi:predicted CoA-binding protein|uniref:CoA-binding protein n=1 Tax=Halolamina sediminis TaxID=1480675 RepID=UPI0006B58557|nr:CoA-binding protein [Halolamina sediminis]
MSITDDDGLRELLDADTIAIVGCSTTEGKAAHDVPSYLQEHGYRIVPINPYTDEILGERAYDSLADVEEEIDLVDVFRPSEETPGIVENVIERHEKRGDAGAVWLQLGIESDEAAELAEEAGLDFVQDHCIKIEHDRLIASA